MTLIGKTTAESASTPASQNRAYRGSRAVPHEQRSFRTSQYSRRWFPDPR